MKGPSSTLRADKAPPRGYTQNGGWSQVLQIGMFGLFANQEVNPLITASDNEVLSPQFSPPTLLYTFQGSRL